MKSALKSLLLIAAVAAAWWWLKPKTYPPGVLIPSDPVQTASGLPAGPWRKNGFSFRALAQIELEARVLHRKTYHSDPAAKIASNDLAIGWGPMSDQNVLDRLTISQGNRFFFWEYQNIPPIPTDAIISHATNMHLISSDNGTAWRIRWLRAGDLIHLRGLLVQVTAPQMPAWTSSLSRTDTGKGACEIVWVQEIEKLHHIPQRDLTSAKLLTRFSDKATSLP